MKILLRAIEGPLAGQIFEIVKGSRLVIGRDPDAGISSADDELSRRHCEISWDGVTCFLRDLHSTNGTLVNGEEVDQVVLKHGDAVRAGQTVLRLEIEGRDVAGARKAQGSAPVASAAAESRTTPFPPAKTQTAASTAATKRHPVEAQEQERPRRQAAATRPQPRVIPDIIEEHAEEAAFLWLLRDRAVGAPHYSLADLAYLDDRIEAHIDGLRIAGDFGWKVCKQGLTQNEPGEVFAATVLALDRQSDEELREALDVAITSPALARAAVSAFGWLTAPEVEARIKLLLVAGSPALRRIAVGAAAIRRYNPGRALSAALEDSDARVRARALRAAGELGRIDLLSAAQRALTTEDPECRFGAAWSVALLGGDATAIRALQVFAESDGPYATRALQMALRRMDLAAATAWWRRMETNPRVGRRAVIAAGIIGDPQCVPWLIERMANDDLARVAGESFSTITGVEIAHEHLNRKPPAESEAEPAESSDDEIVAIDRDENLPWPEPELVRKWWERRQSGFQKRNRYLLGRKIAMGSLEDVFRGGRQRQRAAAALEIAIRQPHQGLPEVRAPGFRQGGDTL